VITFLKPHASHLSLLRVAKPNAILLNAPPPLSRRRRFSRTTASAVNTSLVQQNSSTIASDEPQKVSVLTFQHAIQRLQLQNPSPTCNFPSARGRAFPLVISFLKPHASNLSLARRQAERYPTAVEPPPQLQSNNRLCILQFFSSTKFLDKRQRRGIK
ncbi:hypothetical protein QUC31_008026, partial [Theobroma cacao]